MALTENMSNNELTDAEYEALLSERDSDDDETELAPQAPTNNPAPILGTNDKRYPTMTKLLAMQRELSETVLEGKTEPKDKASCARAWKELEMLRRLMMGKPLTIEAGKPKDKRGGNPMLSLTPSVDQSQAAA